MGKVQIKKEKKRNDILNAAYELFTTKGFESTTIHAISRKAGVGKGTFYLYFSNKTDVKSELILQKSGKLFMRANKELEDRYIKSSEKASVADQVILFIDCIIKYLLEDQKQLMFLAKDISWDTFVNTDKYAGVDEDVVDFKSFIQKRLDESDVKIKNTQLLLFTILELVYSTCYDIYSGDGPVALNEYKPYLYDCVRLLVNNAVEE